MPDCAQLSDRLRLDIEVPVRADDAKPRLLHRAQMWPTREQDDVGARFRKARADVPADGTGPGDRDSHDAVCEYAFATAPRWILPVAVRGMASVMWICFGRL